MSISSFILHEQQLENLFPNYMLFDKNLQLLHHGSKANEVYKDVKVNQFFNEIFTSKKTNTTKIVSNVAVSPAMYTFVETKNIEKINEDVYEFIDNGDTLLFTGKLKVENNKLNLLADSQNRFASLISNLQTGILVEDENRKLVLTNNKFCHLFNITRGPETLIGLDCNRMSEKSKLAFKNPTLFLNNIELLIKNKQTVTNEIIELADGRILSRDFVPIFQNKMYKGHLWNYSDITVQKHAEDTLKNSEEKYRSIIANMKLGLMEVDLNEKIVFVNQSFSDMCGYDMDELVGMKASELFIKGDGVELMESKNEARQRPNSDASEIVIKDKKGNVRWWLISGAPRYNDCGDLVGSIGIHLDITEQKQLEIDLIQAREAAEQSTKSKEAFLANMSHEIRTPMNAILGMSNQLSKTTLTASQTFCLDTINSASENLLVIINDILDLSKIESGKLSLEKIGFEPKQVIKRAMQVLQHKAEEKGLSLTKNILDTNLAPILIGDPYRLNQILLNIISNSIKFTEKGSIDIVCKVEKNTPHTQALKISVHDTGIGMEKKFVKKFFQKFSQEDASVTRRYGGTGLGMSICSDLIALMGGQINVQSDKGIGTIISFVITFDKGNSTDLPSKETFKVNEGMLDMKKILVVDDNEMNRLVATTILKSYGGITQEANNGKEAVDMLATNAFDVVLMDIQMPIMNGFEATSFIRKHISSSIPIIALTANAIKGDNIKCFEAGMNAYVAKPFKEEVLMQIVAAQLQINNNLNIAEMEIVPDKNETYYDITDIKTISRGNQDFIKKMLKMFVDQVPPQIEEMKLKYEAKDFIKMGEVAHKIKPTIDSMGINDIKTTIREVEKLGKSGVDNHQLPDFLRQIEYSITMAVKAIKIDYQFA